MFDVALQLCDSVFSILVERARRHSIYTVVNGASSSSSVTKLQHINLMHPTSQ